ncbi:MAG: hypothetical protein U0Q18_22915 [Bryobacteraceae bacterium]
MTSAVGPEFGIWSAPGHPVRIEYSGPVLDEIRIAAVNGYHLVPRGGIETGGVLFGRCDGPVVRILAWRPIECTHAMGPSFVLSPSDEAGLANLLKSWREDPELAGMEPVGWYHSHTRSEIFLTDLDLKLHDQYFPQPWQVALVIRPASFSPTRAGFFFREGGGSIHAEASYREFPLLPYRGTPPTAQPAVPLVEAAAPAIQEASIKPPAAPPASKAEPVVHAQAASAATGETAVSEVVPESNGILPEPEVEITATAAESAAAPDVEVSTPALVDAQAPQSSHAEVPVAPLLAEPAVFQPLIEPRAGVPLFESITAPPARRRGRLLWYAAALLALAVAAFAVWREEFSYRRLALFAAEDGSQLRIGWDPAATVMREVENASLEIQDGASRTDVKLTPADLRSGAVLYVRQSSDVLIRMIVRTQAGPSVQEVTRFLKPGSPPPVETAAPATPVPAAEREPDRSRQQELERESAAIQERIERQKQELNRLEEMTAAERKRRAAASAERIISPAPKQRQSASPSQAAQLQTKPPERRVETAAATPSTVVPQVNPAAAPPPSSKPVEPLRQEVQLPAPSTPQSAPILRQPETAPSSQPAAAPAPSANAAPAHTTAPAPASGRMIWTGKLAKNGRLVITGNQASAGALTGHLPSNAARVRIYPGELTENGITLFTADPKYSKPLTEAPGAHNGWNRTTYTLDPKRAAGVRIVEQPSPQNGYKLVLQGENPKLSVVIMEWHAAQ